MFNLRSLGVLACAAFALTSLPSCSGIDMPATARVSQAGSLAVSGYDPGLGLRLASQASNGASGGTGLCYQYVASAIHAELPAFLTGMHAYMAADQLATSPAFRELAVAADSLPALPAGAVVVWSRGSSESGHISIADGRGYEISDHVAPQMTSHYGGGSYRVFVPATR